jgi:hypothetical protein
MPRSGSAASRVGSIGPIYKPCSACDINHASNSVMFSLSRAAGQIELSLVRKLCEYLQETLLQRCEQIVSLG